MTGFDEIRTYAKENNLLEIFNETYSRLENYFAKGYQVTLYSDFAPLSMEFSITNEGKLVLYGGFIFHGPHDGYGSGSAPTFYHFPLTGKLDGHKASSPGGPT